MILLIRSPADGQITQSKGLQSDCSREARVESSTKNLLAVKIMLVIGNRINYSVAQFGTGLGFWATKCRPGLRWKHNKGIALPQLFIG